MARRAGCPDPALIAAHVEHRLSGDEAARMDEHIAGCAECYEIFSETLQFHLAEGEDAPAKGADSPAVAPLTFRQRPAFRTAVGLATAAALVAAIGVLLYRVRVDRNPTPLVAELAEAMGTRRFVEPRLTGGFQHGRLIVLRAEGTPPGLDAESPAVLAAVARIRARAAGDTSPEALDALGITYLVSGDVGAAVKALESASAQAPDDPRVLTDLSAAYLVRAQRMDEPADLPKALEAAERAIVLKDVPVEAYFNRALALERLHLVDAARKAWTDYLDRDPSSQWADEARQHLEALPKPRRSSAEEDKARVRAAVEAGSDAIDRLTEESPSLVREYFENELLPAWADAHLVGSPDANVLRARAVSVGEALSRTTTDTMPRDTARALVSPELTAPSQDPLRSQALGYRAWHEARRLYDLQESSCSAFRAALAALEAGGSPHAAWTRLEVVDACVLASDPLTAMTELRRLEPFAKERGYLRVVGRSQWLQGLIHLHQGEFMSSLERYRSAEIPFRASKDVDSDAFILAQTAENIDLLGETSRSWQYRVQGLSLLEEVRNPRRRHAILSESAVACVADRLPRTALHFGMAVVETALGWARPMAVSEALLRRAGIHHALGTDALAAADVIESRGWIERIANDASAQREKGEADAADGEILVGTRPEAAARSLRGALTYFQTAAPMRVPALHLLLARAQAARGLDDETEAELLAGIQALEHERTSLRDAALQVSFFDQALPLFDDMVRLQVTRRRDPERALAFVERGRARQLVDSLAGSAVDPLSPDALRRELPAGLALIYYVALDDRLLAWAVTRDRADFIERSLPAAELSRLVAANRAALEERAPQQVVRRTAARLHDELVGPLIPFIASQRALIFIPDGILQTIAFAGLWDRQTRRYLVEDYALGVVPSGSVFVRASKVAAAPHNTTPRALIVGNPRFDRHLWSGSDLPGAEAEAVDVARLYDRSELLIGSRATKAAFLDALQVSDVVHYAGHAVATANAPTATRLLLAPDPRTGDSGALYLDELARRGLPRTRVVVLAACRTAAGTVSRVEGALCLGRPFLAAGVPTVVASLGDIEDAVSQRFFLAFHRALLQAGDPLEALRGVQLAFLHSDDATLSHPASWATFICLGGIGPHSFSKGDVS